MREELESLKKQLTKKRDEQTEIVKRDGGTDSYAYKLLDKTIRELRDAVEEKHEQLIHNFDLINEVQKSKNKVWNMSPIL